MEQNEGVLKKAIRGGKWMFLKTLLEKVISLASFFVLARLLFPEDFGIMSLILVVPSLLNLITTIGFEFTLIQSKEDPKKYLNEAWTFNILRVLVIFVIMFFSAPLVASFFHLEKAIWAVRLSGVFFVISSLGNIAQLYFFKDIDFKKIFIRDIAVTLSYSLVAIGIAIFYRSFWALFFGYIGQYIMSAAITYFLHEYRPRLSVKLKVLKSLISYSKWIFGQNLIINAIPMIENGLIGRMIGATGVGLYTRAKSLASFPSAPLFGIFEKVTYPAYAKIQDSYEKIRDGFIKSLDLLFFLSVPFILVFMDAGQRLILIFLGEKWMGMDALLKVLLIAMTISVLTTLSGPIFNAIGKPKIQFYINAVNMATLVSLFLILVPRYGAEGAAVGILINAGIIFLISFYKIARILRIKISGVIKPLMVPLVASLAMMAAEKLLFAVFPKMSDIAFIALIICMGIFYLALILLSGLFLKSGPYATLRLILSEVFKK